MNALLSVTFTAFAAFASAGSLKDIKHVVLFMQENRAFDHYFGTMAGVRGFADPNVQVNPDGKNTFQQLVPPSESNATSILTPWYANYLGGVWYEATKCMGAGDNSWQAMHYALNNGLTNEWVSTNTPYSWAHFQRRDIPTHWDIAEGWTVGDMYQEAVLAATDPNRIIWMSATVNNPGTPSNPNGQGGMILDNSATPGCEQPHLNCYPFVWKTVPEYWQNAGVSWQVYQNRDNFEDSMLAYFKQYQQAGKNSPLTTRGNSYIGISQFVRDAAAGKLPEVSYIVGPAELSEHYPYLTSDGAWLQKKIVDAVTSSPAYNQTVLMISYDEVGGYGDHVTPFYAPKGTPGEWINDPYGLFGETPVGPGFRLPFYIISPWTRGGNVFTEHADHNSQIMFVEQWLEAIGKKNVRTAEMPPWRRAHMSNLLKAFDFDHPDYSIPGITPAPAPLRNSSQPPPQDGQLGALSGNYIGAAKCQSEFKSNQPPVPYGQANANANPSNLVEDGFKQVRGSLTEGRFLTFEMSGRALTNDGSSELSTTTATAQHNSITQRWILHQVGAGDSYDFTISSAQDGRFLSSALDFVKTSGGAGTFTIMDLGNGAGHSLAASNGRYVMIDNSSGKVTLGKKPAGFSLFSVTYK